MIPAPEQSPPSSEAKPKVAPIPGLKRDSQAEFQLQGRVVSKEVCTLALSKGIEKTRSNSPKGVLPNRASGDNLLNAASPSSNSPHSGNTTPKDNHSPKLTAKESPTHSPKTGSPLGDTASGSPSRTRRRSSAGLITNFRNSLPRSIMGSQIAATFLNLPEQNDSAWDNLDEYPDSFIIKLSKEEFAKVPVSRIQNMPPEILSQASLEQIRSMKSSEIAQILLIHGSKLDTKFLQILEPEDFRMLEPRTKISVFCPDAVFSKLSLPFQRSLQFERTVYDTQRIIHTMSKDDILQIKFEVLNTISIDILVNLDNACRRVIVDKYYQQMTKAKTKQLCASFTEHDWSLLNPDFIEEFLKQQDPSAPLPFSPEFLAKVKERNQCRQQIRLKLTPHCTASDLKPFQRMEFIDTFTSMLKIDGMTRFRMRPELFAEAATMPDFDFLKEITNLEIIAAHVCASIINRIFPLFKAREIIEEIDTLNKVARFYSNDKKSQTALLTKDCRVVIGSLYPCQAATSEKNKKRLCDPIEDDMIYQKIASENRGQCIAFAAARGTTTGFHEKGSIQANRLFIEYVDQFLKSGICDISNMLKMVVMAQQSFLQKLSKYEVAQAGLVALKIPGEKSTVWEVAAVTIGDHKIFHYSQNLKRCVEVTRGSLNHVTVEGDMGGKLGLYLLGRTSHGVAYPDFRNYCIATITAEDGDIIIPVSQGVHEQMDPQNLGLTPLEACTQLLDEKVKSIQELLQSDVKESDLQTWTRSPECKRIKEMYLEMKATKLVQRSIKKQENVAITFSKYCRKVTHNMRAWMEQNNTSEHPTIGDIKEVKTKEGTQMVKMYGRFAHFSVAAIELK